MPRKKASRAPSRAKPTVPNDSIVVPDMEAEARKEKMKLLLKDFDAQVKVRVSKMEEEIWKIQESIRHMYKTDLICYSEATRNTLWINYVKQKNQPKSAMRDSVTSMLSSVDNILACAKKKKERAKGNSKEDLLAPPSATKSIRSNRQKKVLGTSQVDNMQPPTSTVRATRIRKVNLEVTTTPANQSICSAYISSMTVTPKFDPRTPLPPGTIKRKPKVGEIAISLTGSPLQVSPKGLMSSILTEDLDEDTKAELIMFHKRVGKFLNL